MTATEHDRQSDPDELGAPHGLPVLVSTTPSQDRRDRSPIQLVVSEEPSVVFTSLAAQCVPELCDECTIDILDGTHARYRIAYPTQPFDPGGARRVRERAAVTNDHVVRVPFGHPRSDLADRRREHHETGLLETYSGVATFVWHARTATRIDRTMAGALVDDAVHTVAWQRSEQTAALALNKAEQMTIALRTSRHIGAAVGVLMSLHKITQDEAFALLRMASQHANRKVRDVALDVIDTGWLDPALISSTPIHPRSPHEFDTSRHGRASTTESRRD